MLISIKLIVNNLDIWYASLGYCFEGFSSCGCCGLNFEAIGNDSSVGLCVK